MLQKKTQTFNDGNVKIYSVADPSASDAEPTGDLPSGDMPDQVPTLKQTLRYHERTVGVTRYYAALKDDMRIDSVIRCPRVDGISGSKSDILIAVPKDGLQYKVVQTQYPEDVDPPVMDLSLERLGEDYDIQ